METYHKIQTLFKRDLDGTRTGKKGKMMPGEWTTPELAYLADKEWEFTEKVDGTNIRIGWNPFAGFVEFAGRTDNAVIPKPLIEHLENTFTPDLFFSAGLLGSFVLFGEGYGPKIQGGGKYRDDHSFVLFDIVSKSGTIEEWNTNHSDPQSATPSEGILLGGFANPATERSSERSPSFEKSGTSGHETIETPTNNESITPARAENGTSGTSLESLSKSTRKCLTCKVEFVPFASNQKLPRVEMETLLRSRLTIATIRYVLEGYCAEDVMSVYSRLTSIPDGSNQPQPISHDFWLDRENVDDIASKLGIDSVPTLGYGTLYTAISIVSDPDNRSTWGDFVPEGIVARPIVPLFNRKGERIITKIKEVDFR